MNTTVAFIKWMVSLVIIVGYSIYVRGVDVLNARGADLIEGVNSEFPIEKTASLGNGMDCHIWIMVAIIVLINLREIEQLIRFVFNIKKDEEN